MISLKGQWLGLLNACGSMKDLADALGCGQPSIYRWSHHWYKPQPAMQKRIAALAKRMGVACPSFRYRPTGSP